MEFFRNFNTAVDLDPGLWALEREAEGYDGVVASDHLWVGGKRWAKRRSPMSG